LGFGEISKEQFKLGGGIMAITLGVLVERLEDTLKEIESRNYGHAAQRLTNTIRILEESGIIIHALARTGNKKVEEHGRDEKEE